MYTVSGSLRYACAAVRMCSSAWYAFCLSVNVTALEQGVKINMSLWSRGDSSRETLFIYLQVEITGQILPAKGLEIHHLLVCNLGDAHFKTNTNGSNFSKWEKCSDESVFFPLTAALYY